MDTLEFLGGKYQGAEQILPGVIQTYRAQEASTGRSVFVHRIASSDDPGDQLVLYRLLSAALVRSAGVRKMVLDVRDEGADWFVVTETAPQCLLLREWLQFELNNAGKPAEAERAVPRPSAAEPVAAKAADEPGEFTRFFKGGLPTPPAPKTAGGERPSRTGIVQRPNTPMPYVPPTPSRKDEPGEFTKLFNRSENASAPAPAASSPQSSRDFDNLFGPKAETPMPLPAATPAPGEYTKIFGKNNVPPPVQTPAGLGERARTDFDDPLAAPGASRPAPPVPAVSAGPSEYTRVISGNRTASPAAAADTKAEAPPAPQVSIPAPPGLAVPTLPPPPAVAMPPLPKRATPAPSNQKFVIFLVVLGVLALLLILLVYLALRK